MKFVISLAVYKIRLLCATCEISFLCQFSSQFGRKIRFHRELPRFGFGACNSAIYAGEQILMARFVNKHYINARPAFNNNIHDAKYFNDSLGRGLFTQTLAHIFLPFFEHCLTEQKLWFTISHFFISIFSIYVQSSKMPHLTTRLYAFCRVTHFRERGRIWKCNKISEQHFSHDGWVCDNTLSNSINKPQE